MSGWEPSATTVRHLAEMDALTAGIDDDDERRDIERDFIDTLPDGASLGINLVRIRRTLDSMDGDSDEARAERRANRARRKMHTI